MASADVHKDVLKYLRGFSLQDRNKTKPGVCYKASADAAHAAGIERLIESLRLQKEEQGTEN